MDIASYRNCSVCCTRQHCSTIHIKSPTGLQQLSRVSVVLLAAVSSNSKSVGHVYRTKPGEEMGKRSPHVLGCRQEWAAAVIQQTNQQSLDLACCFHSGLTIRSSGCCLQHQSSGTSTLMRAFNTLRCAYSRFLLSVKECLQRLMLHGQHAWAHPPAVTLLAPQARQLLFLLCSMWSEMVGASRPCCCRTRKCHCRR